MRTIFLITVFFLCKPVLAEHDDSAACRKVKADIRYVQSRMRAGYTRAEGEKLEARLRKLRIRKRKACR